MNMVYAFLCYRMDRASCIIAACSSLCFNVKREKGNTWEINGI